MGFVETSQAVEMSGSRFASLMREAVLLELALVQWVTAKLVAEGFTPVVPPVLVREQAMEEAGFFPTDRAQVYEVDGGELFLVGTSEVPLSALHRDEILTRRFVAAPLRRHLVVLPARGRHLRQGHARDLPGAPVRQGRDVLVRRSRPVVGGARADARDRGVDRRRARLAVPRGEHRRRRSRRRGGEEVRHRGVAAVGGRYRELTSCSNYLDYSARRLSTRVRGEGGNQLVHTLNGTACAIGRTLVFLFEHYQDADGAFVGARRAAPVLRLRPRRTRERAPERDADQDGGGLVLAEALQHDDGPVDRAHELRTIADPIEVHDGLAQGLVRAARVATLGAQERRRRERAPEQVVVPVLEETERFVERCLSASRA